MSINDLSDTIIAKSDQLNADDLVSGSRVITVVNVVRGNNENPIIIHYQGDSGRPFKPCKTVRKLLCMAWTTDGNNWIGKSMQLYRDPSVKYAGVEVGGIRVSHLSDIPSKITASLALTRGKKKQYIIDVLQPQAKPPYPAEQFSKSINAMSDMIASGTMTAEQVINKCEQTGALTDDQKQTIRGMEK